MKPEAHPQAEEAARYVLGQLSPPARAAFEAHLAQSAELRALVQEVEEGIEALAHAVPQRPPPPQLWTPIEQAIAREAERKIVKPQFWSRWWQYGAAAAAACVLGWLGFMLGVRQAADRATTAATQPDMAAANVPAPRVTETGSSPPPPQPAVTQNEPLTTNWTDALTVAGQLPDTFANAEELLRLRGQVAVLRSELGELAKIVSQQAATMAEPGRFQFFPLQTSETDAGRSATPTQLSPGLQRAIFYAMAQDLGWVPPPTTAPTLTPTSEGSPRTAWGIDFVELKTPDNTSTTIAAVAQPAASSEANLATTVSVRTSGEIPGYLKRDAGKDLVLAFDPTIVASGSTIEFWSGSAVSGFKFVGRTMTGENPLVVTIPTEQLTGDLTISTHSGPTPPKVIGQFFISRQPLPTLSPPQPSAPASTP